MVAKIYTTAEAAKQIGVSRQALYLWIAAGKVKAPKPITLGGRTMRLWSQAEIQRARKFNNSVKRRPARPKFKR